MKAKNLHEEKNWLSQSRKAGPLNASFTSTNQIPYKELLQTREWKEKREVILLRDNGTCCNCGKQLDLEVHHKQYHIKQATGHFKRPWDYEDKYLITLCHSCHKIGHKKFKIPVFTI